MKRIALAIGALAAIVAVLVILVARTRHEAAETHVAVSPLGSPAAPASRGSEVPQPAGSTHFLPQLPPRQIVPQKPSIFEAPPKAQTGNPP